MPAAPAAALDRYVPMKVPPGPGPAKYDRVFVEQLGPASARTVLVLVPGTNGGAGAIVPVARHIVRRVPGMQVWIADRREQAFEDTSVFRTGDPQLCAYKRPDEPSVLQQYPGLPDSVKPPVRVTNEALLGYAFDETTSPDFLSIIHLRAGRLADRGDPRGWEDGELTPIRRHAKAWAAERPNATEWYYPRRLLLDIDAASPLRQTAAARYLGLRLRHGKRIDVPLYAYSTDLTDGAVARGARRLVRIARIRESRVVDDRHAAHLDPLSAAPKTNRFLKTVVPFLRRHVR